MADQPSFSAIALQEHDGARADRFIADQSGALSRSRVKSLMEEGRVLCNGTPLREPAHTVRVGNRYECFLPDPVSAVPAAQLIPLDILYEDAHLLVINKPAGLVVHPAPGHEDGTLVNALLAHCGDSLPGIGGEKRPGIVHRLDKDTSGVMVVAKSEKALTTLSEDFAARRIERAYTALCWGVLSPAEGDMQGNIGRDPRDRKRMAVVARGGKHALTHYKTLKTYGSAASLVECRLATGRTHQIRAHFSYYGHPLLGDPVYIRRTPSVCRFLEETTRRACLDFARQALHAHSLGFVHPVTGERIRFETEIPPDFANLLKILDDSCKE